MDIQEIEIGCKNMKGFKGGTHVWLRNIIFDSLGNIDEDAADKFNEDMGELSYYRVKADYQHNPIGRNEANKAISLAKSTIDLLKDKYGI